MALCDGVPLQQLSRGQQGKRTDLHGWLRPPLGTIKINCDGARCNRIGMGGFGWVARDFVGVFKGVGGVGNIMCVSSVMAKAEAVRLALMWCVEGGLESVQLENDSQVFADMIRGSFIGRGLTTFNVLDYGALGDGKTDDSTAFLKAWNVSCVQTQGISSTLDIPANKTYLLQPTKFSGPCKSSCVHVQILGKIVAPSNLDAWKECGSESWLTFLKVTNLIINGTGDINGQGSPWWSNATLLNHILNALHFNQCDNLQLSGFTHRDSPKARSSINNCKHVTISNLHIIAPENSPNTDGIDISVSSYVNIHDSVIGTGDDCIAIINGSSYINITNIACGPGQGISVGSLGEHGAYGTAEAIHVRNCNFNGTQNGARIKTWQGGCGYAKNISFKQIKLVAAKNPIIIDQHYWNGRHDCKNYTSAVSVTDVSYSDFQGTSETEEAIKFDCSEPPGCINIVMDQINLLLQLLGRRLEEGRWEDGCTKEVKDGCERRMEDDEAPTPPEGGFDGIWGGREEDEDGEVGLGVAERRMRGIRF
ncbi:probable polygalacturonase At3g15720 [Pyrus communis]|uniref:probable polygalacturonase At3g15720 n=1 Tax=Pyrus communis TaxID=23211 RepID=UPI0035C000EA